MRKRNTKWIVLFLVPSLLMYCSFFLYPTISVFVTSFCKWDGYTAPKFIGFDNYVKLAKSPAFQQSLKNLIIWALCAIVIHVPFGVLVALILGKKLKGWRFTRAVFMLPNVIAPSAMALMFVFFFKPDEGILNSLIRLFGVQGYNRNWLYSPDTALFSLTLIWLFYAAVITLITLAELFSISEEMIESARIDGASTWQIDWYIHLPLIRKTIGTGMIIAVTAVFHKFDIIYITTNGGPGNATMTLSVMMVNAISNTMSYGYANAIGVALILLGVIVMQTCNRLFKMDRSAYE